MAILARNHRWFVIANYGAARVGARTIMLNTEFSGPQIRDVSEREGAKLIIYDDEYAEAVKLAEPPLGKLRALGTNPDTDSPSGSTDETLAEVIKRSSTAPAPKATKRSSIIILTSGTTGTPKERPGTPRRRWRRSAAFCPPCRSAPARSPRCRRRCFMPWDICMPPSP